MPGSPLANRFLSLVPGPMYWYPGQWNSIPVLDKAFCTSNRPPLCRLNESRLNLRVVRGILLVL